MNGTAIVVGGGIGGLAAARALLRKGWDVTLFEQAPAFGAVGAGIALAPNAVRALDWLGLGAGLRSRGMAQGAAGIRTASGRWLMRTRIEELEERFGVPAFALHRADLYHMLAEAISAATLQTGRRATSVSNHGDEATVTYEGPDGTGKETADLVVVADGIHSRLRTVLFPEHPGPAYAGYITWRGIIPTHATSGLGLDAAVTETWGRGGKRFGVAPLADGRVYWFATATLPKGAHTDDTLADVAARYRGWHAPIPQLLDSTPPEALLRHDIYHLETPLPTYVVGRVALLGDAAHAVTPDLGQGAAQALEDAVTLAAMATRQLDVPATLAAYDQARRPRTQRLVQVSWKAGRVAQWRNPLAVTLRNTLARLTPPSAYLRSMSDTFSWTPPPTDPGPEGCRR
ncbi:MAG: FAD-dependent monooxygenase [Chloroflexia bacterium]|nr:FAD-dependent monooxygenase [Chloroflexia bacterium]